MTTLTNVQAALDSKYYDERVEPLLHVPTGAATNSPASYSEEDDLEARKRWR